MSAGEHTRPAYDRPPCRAGPKRQATAVTTVISSKPGRRPRRRVTDVPGSPRPVACHDPRPSRRRSAAGSGSSQAGRMADSIAQGDHSSARRARDRTRETATPRGARDERESRPTDGPSPRRISRRRSRMRRPRRCSRELESRACRRTRRSSRTTSIRISASRPDSASPSSAAIDSIFRTEHSGRVRWQRDVGVWIDVTGARTVLPGIPDIGEREARKGIAKAGDDMLPVPYFPGYEALWAGPEAARVSVDENGPVHPLAEGSEAYYTYRTGDSLDVTLPDHRVIHLRVARRASARGEMESHGRLALVRRSVGAARARRVPVRRADAHRRIRARSGPHRVRRRAGVGQADDVPDARRDLGDHDRVRACTADGSGCRATGRRRYGDASFMRMPFKVEQTFKYNSVNGTDSLPRVPLAAVAASTRFAVGGSAKVAWRDSVVNARIRRIRAHNDSVRVGLFAARARSRSATRASIASPRRADSAMLAFRSRRDCRATSRHSRRRPIFPKSIYDPGDQLFDLKRPTSADRGSAVDGSAAAAHAEPARAAAPRVGEPGSRCFATIASKGLSRRRRGEPSPRRRIYRAGDGPVRHRRSHAQSRPLLTRTNLSRSVYVGAYRHLVPAGDWGNPLSFGSSVSAVLFGRDEGFYYRATGAELGRTHRTGHADRVAAVLGASSTRRRSAHSSRSAATTRRRISSATSALYSGAGAAHSADARRRPERV